MGGSSEEKRSKDTVVGTNGPIEEQAMVRSKARELLEPEKANLVIANVKRILAQRHVRIGNFEESIRLSRGYLSRFSNPDAKLRASSVTVELLERMADGLRVGPYNLVQDYHECTEDEVTTIDFLDTMCWNIRHQQCKCRIYKFSDDTIDLGPIQSLELNEEGEGIIHLGAFSIGDGVTIDGVWYDLVEPRGDFEVAESNQSEIPLRVYLYPVWYTNKELKDSRQSIEVYVEHGIKHEEQFFLCSSVLSNKMIQGRIGYLFQAIQTETKRNTMDPKLRNLLLKYNGDQSADIRNSEKGSEEKE